MDNISVLLVILTTVVAGLVVVFTGRFVEPLQKVKRVVCALGLLAVLALIAWYRNRQGMDLVYAVTLILVAIAAVVFRGRIAANLARAASEK